MQPDRKNLRVTRLLQRELSGSDTVLDLGCGPSSLIQYVKGPTKTVGVEYWKPSMEESRQRGIHTEYINADITSVMYPDASFDSIILIDVLEHFEKEHAIELLKKIQRWTKKNVIVVVPNGFVPQEEDIGDSNKKQHHLSGWTVKDLGELGFRVRGIGGVRYLRGERGQIIPTRTRPGHYLLAGISKISEPFTEILPGYAYHLFAVWEREAR
jgi:SAM-dependent methyltransferase